LAHAALGNYTEAVSDFTKATELRPEDTHSWLGLARSLAEEERWQEAVAACSRGLELDAASWQLLFLRGIGQVRLKAWPDALADLASAAEKRPEALGIATERATATAEGTGIPAAMELLEAAADRWGGSDVNKRYELALAYYEVADTGWRQTDSDKQQTRLACVKSAELLTDITALTPNGVYLRSLGAVLNLLGNIESEAGAKDRAEIAFARAINAYTQAATDPQIDDMRDRIAGCQGRLGSVRLDLGKISEAVTAYEKRVELYRELNQERDEVDLRDNLVTALGSLSFGQLFAQQPSLAMAAAQEALDMDASQLWIRTNLAHAYLFSEDYETAVQIYQQYKDEMISDTQSFGAAVLEDFRLFRAQGVSHPDMERVEQLLASG
jgi:tetratricopeptide (TPR) repeat protein